MQGNAYYIVSDGAYASHTLAHINESIAERGFNVTVKDVRNQIGILSIQGPRRLFEYLYFYYFFH